MFRLKTSSMFADAAAIDPVILESENSSNFVLLQLFFAAFFIYFNFSHHIAPFTLSVVFILKKRFHNIIVILSCSAKKHSTPHAREEKEERC